MRSRTSCTPISRPKFGGSTRSVLSAPTTRSSRRRRAPRSPTTTSSSAYAVQPHRNRVITAKAIAAALAALVMGMVTMAVLFAVGIPWLALTGTSLRFDGHVWTTIALGALVLAVTGAMGVGVGAI